ncbi:MAG: Hpt domain-containing protein [Gammaproteobacteria bacterium]|nr:Hpt domain-containing protein [Gammaproteobacteria bacterium]
MNSPLRTIDAALALERAGGNRELACELYQMLQKELPDYLTAITQHHDSGNFAALLEVVHKLHGSATYCGVPALREAAATLERRLKQGAEDGYSRDVDDIVREIRHLQQTPKLTL